ncbi:hypothetical protein HW555_000084 [Spodoptera exigua]|uniref:Uncharacterized protein n=1 Tax=Spodoptera exigua TaxID=7107 RepID=A0A835GWL1_SPOEX|nr:hypothetical protein HW555_000084 [Spodoptera exigua]
MLRRVVTRRPITAGKETPMDSKWRGSLYEPPYHCQAEIQPPNDNVGSRNHRAPASLFLPYDHMHIS